MVAVLVTPNGDAAAGAAAEGAAPNKPVLGAVLPNSPVVLVVVAAVLPNSPEEGVLATGVPNNPPLAAGVVIVAVEVVEPNKPPLLEVVVVLPNSPPPPPSLPPPPPPAGVVALLAAVNRFPLIAVLAGALLNRPVVAGLANRLEVKGLLVPVAGVLPNKPPDSGAAVFVSSKPNGFLGDVEDLVSSDEIFRPNNPLSLSPELHGEMLALITVMIILYNCVI